MNQLSITGSITGLTTGSEWSVLDPNSDISDAIQARLEDSIEPLNEQDLTRVMVPAGGSTVWAWTDIDGEKTSKEVEGLLVHVQKRGILWPHEKVTGDQPLLRTDDLISAYRVGGEYGDINPDELEKYALPNGQYDWQKLPWNQWGTGQDGIGKRCRELRLLFILRREDSWPLMVQIPPGSVRSVSSFLTKLAYRIPCYRAIVRLSLQRAESEKRNVCYSQVVPMLVGSISKEEGEIIKRLYTDPIRQVAQKIEVNSME
jgi:hypothetical protein